MSSSSPSSRSPDRASDPQASSDATRGAGPRDISVSEFFTKNRHLLGFDSPGRAILTAVKEAVDNSLDACEEAGILPEVEVEVSEALREHTYRVVVTDNGPGIDEAQIGKIFGKLLYGSKFHRMCQSRGQQGIGISAAGMYGQLTTGRPMSITSRRQGEDASHFLVSVDTAKNRPHIHRKEQVSWDRPHGTQVELEMEGHYQRGQHSVEMYLKQTAITNPHVTLRLRDPQGEETTLTRSVSDLPESPIAVKPHPHGLELGRLLQMLKETRQKSLKSFLVAELGRVGDKTADAIIDKAQRRLTPRSRPRRLTHRQADALLRALTTVPVSAPRSDCVVPVGEELIRRGLGKELEAEFYTAVTRPPAVYRGNPFVVEVGLAYGHPGGVGLELMEDGHIVKKKAPPRHGPERMVAAADEPVHLLRFANRVPLLYQQSACAITKAVLATNWKAYGLPQPKGALPVAPMAILVHIASVWVPFTSESKEAIASYPEIAHELKLGLQECGRRLASHLGKNARLKREYERRATIERYLPHIGEALQEILGLADEERDRTVDRLDAILHGQRHAP